MTKNSARKKAIRARQAETGEAYNAARRALDAHAVEHGEHSAGIAECDWWRHAMVRLTRDVTTGSPYVDRPTHYRGGQVLTLWQTGRKDRPIDTTQWTTSLDVDLMGFIPDDAVTLVEVLEEVPPRRADPVEPMHTRLARRWRRAMALVEHVAGDDTATIGDQVMVHEHRKEVTRAVRYEIERIRRDGDHPDPALLALTADILEQVKVRWRVEQAQETAAVLRAMAARPEPALAVDLNACLDSAETALTEALTTDGALGVDARLTPRELETAEVRFGARLAAVIDTERTAGQ